MATENTQTSSKFKDIISKCDEIQKVSPACYRLTTKADNIGTLRRVTFGKKNPNKINKTILLVGETGAGKSTLINTLLNYSMGVKFEDDIWFEIVEEEKRSQSESQTLDVIVYEIFDFKDKTLPYSLTIIDTPGYGNTKEVERDVIVTQRLFDLFRSKKGVHEIDAVGLVVKACECRLSDRLVYVFDSVMSLFGKDLEKNIIALITYSNGLTPTNTLEALNNAKVRCARDEKNQPVYFLFDNCQTVDRKENREHLEHADKITMRGMSQFTEFLGKLGPQKLQETVDVLNDRIRLTACIQNLQDRIKLIELKRREIEQTQSALKKYEQQMKMNKEFTVEVDEVYKGKETIDGGMWGMFFFEAAVCCTFCEENCHYPGCTVAWSPGRCEVMKKGRCTVCKRKCLASAHVKEDWIYVSKTRKVKKTLTDVKEKYERNKAETVKAASLLENLQKEMENLEEDKARWLEEAYEHVDRLNQIALNVDSLSTYVHYDFLIEKMKEKGDTEKVQKLEEKTHRVGEMVRTGAQYAYERICKIFKGNKNNRSDTEV